MSSEELRGELDRIGERIDELLDQVAKLRFSERFRVEVDALAVPIPEAARLAGIGLNEFRELVRSHQIRSVPVGPAGVRRVIPVSAIADYLERAAAESDKGAIS
jgi:predicted HTH domain antitoxin